MFDIYPIAVVATNLIQSTIDKTSSVNNNLLLLLLAGKLHLRIYDQVSTFSRNVTISPYLATSFSKETGKFITRILLCSSL